MHLFPDGQDDASGEFVVGHHLVASLDNIEGELLTKNEKTKQI